MEVWSAEEVTSEAQQLEDEQEKGMWGGKMMHSALGGGVQAMLGRGAGGEEGHRRCKPEMISKIWLTVLPKGFCTPENL